MAARQALLAVMRKELRQTFRDRRMTAMLVAAPVLQLVLLGYAVDLDVDRVATVVCDQDRTPTSRRLVRALLADGTLRAVGEVARPDAALLAGDVHAVIVLPRGLDGDLRAGRSAQVQVLVDGSDSVRGQVVDSAAVQFFYREALALAAQRLQKSRARALLAGGAPPPPPQGAIVMVPRVLYNPSMKSPVYMVPGVAAIVLLLITTVITAMGIAREREMGTIEQLLITPMRPTVLLLGKILPFALVGLIVAGVVIAVGAHLFGVPVRGPLSALFAGTLIYLLTTLGAGILVSTIARTQQQAILGALFFMMPAILLSGFATPVESMPSWIRPVTLINPMYYYLGLLRANLLKGAGFADLAHYFGGLLFFGGLIFSLAVLRFRRQHAA